jgi:pilus assembly protein Flp/PilA
MNLPHREEGQGLVEYALVLVLVAVAIILILTVLGSSVALVYVRVVGGLSGQSITSTGTEYVVLDADINVGGSFSCNVAITNARVAVVQDGKLLANSASGNITVSGTGVSPTTMSGNTNNIGIAEGMSASLNGVTCGGQLTIGNSGYSIPVNP